MDPALPEAEAIALLGERIVAVGTDSEIVQIRGPQTETIDLKGATVLPGFIDCHIHLIEYGLSLGNLELRDVSCIADLKKRVAEGTRKASSWVLGRGWDQEKFVEKRYPMKHDLDEVSPTKPVLLRRVCGHIGVANSAALRTAGIDEHTADPEGGTIDRDSSGQPTGVLRETAIQMVESKVPPPTFKDYEEATIAASERALAAGLTTVHCIIDSAEEFKALLELKRQNKLALRFYIFIPAGGLQLAKQMGLSTGFGDEWVRLGGVKIFTDGSLGGHTAALEAPYNDAPTNRGMTIYNQAQLNEMVAEIHQADFQVAAHAIGDRAVGMALSALERAKKTLPKKELRDRIEHASVLNSELIQRMRDGSFIASVQPQFIVSDFWVEKRLGVNRARMTYPFASLLRSGVRVVGGSDCPVEPLDPLKGIAAATNRKESGESVGVGEAIAFYTRDAAYASFEEGQKGTISPTKYADLVVLQKDLRKVAPPHIPEIPILMTIVGGKVMYRGV
jgi:predicted amidohydrolase YtcJ